MLVTGVGARRTGRRIRRPRPLRTMVRGDRGGPNMTSTDAGRRPAALITGAGRRVSIGAGIVRRLANDGWNLALSYGQPSDIDADARPGSDDPDQIAADARRRGATVVQLPGDLTDPDEPDRLLAAAVDALGPLRGLVLSHAESRDSGILDTTVESFDRHLTVNARASWQLIAAFGRQARDGGAIVALTSDAVVENVPYGASKGALDRIVTAAARELGDRGIRVNAVNPGPVDTGWMDDDLRVALARRQPTGRLGTPDDVAKLISFLLSDDGAWTTGQLIHTDGGFSIQG